MHALNTSYVTFALGRIWDVSAPQKASVMEGHDASVESLALSPDGLSMLSGSFDKTVR